MTITYRNIGALRPSYASDAESRRGRTTRAGLEAPAHPLHYFRREFELGRYSNVPGHVLYFARADPVKRLPAQHWKNAIDGDLAAPLSNMYRAPFEEFLRQGKLTALLPRHRKRATTLRESANADYHICFRKTTAEQREAAYTGRASTTTATTTCAIVNILQL